MGKPRHIDHVDQFIWERFNQDNYARLVLMIMRLPAAPRADWAPWLDGFRLFCTHNGNRYRVVMASRLGDIGLSVHFERDSGYQLRVSVEECSDWGPTADGEQGGR